MSGVYKTHVRPHIELEPGWRGYALVALFAVVIGGALLVRPMWISNGVEPAFSGATTGEQAAVGSAWAIAEAIFAAVLIAIILAYRWLPEWVQDIVNTVATVILWMILGAVALEAGQFWDYAFAGIGLIALLKTTEQFDVWWILNNMLALGIAIGMAAWIGVVLSPWILAIGLIGLSVYDYVFADRENWMFTLGGSFVRWRMPVLFVAPTTLRVDWDELADGMAGELDDKAAPELGFGIGTADLMIPAAFVVSLVNAGPSIIEAITVFAVITGILVACFRVSWKMVNKGGGAGLPPLTSGAIGGWAIGSIVVMLL
jgi:presenilin-like A22 family membrane protease